MNHALSSLHIWVIAPDRAGRRAAFDALQPCGLALEVDAHRRLRGPYTAAGELLRLIVPGLLTVEPGVVERHDVEILTAAPDLQRLVDNRRETLTSMASPEERTRFYPRAHTLRIAHGLCELLRAWAARQKDVPVLLLDRMDAADHTDQELIAIMLRRCDPGVLRLVVGTGCDVPTDVLADALRTHASRAPSPTPSWPESSGEARRTTDELANAFVASECTSDDPAERDAYERLSEQRRIALHDARAEELERRDELSLQLGAIPFHREHGSDPAGAGFGAIRAALERCVLSGCYHAVLELGERARGLIDARSRPEDAWLVTAKVVTALTALGRPNEAAHEYDTACAATTLPIAHLQAAYGRAMLYTRFYDNTRRDHVKAKAWINTAIALAQQLPEQEWRAFNLTLNENGLALIEMHLGDLEHSLRLIDDGLERLERELGPGRQTLHRSVLRYNRAQLLARLRRTDDALEAYDELIAMDPNHSEYYLERAGILRSVGRLDCALADLDEAIRLSPPYPEARYNRGELWLERGEPALAGADFSYVLELDPTFVDAYLNRASALCDMGLFDDAQQDVQAGLRLAADSPHLHGLAGMILHHQGRLEEAECSYEAAVRADPQLAEIWANRAALAFDQGDAGTAVAYLNRAIDLAGPLPDLLANREVATNSIDHASS